MKLSKQTISTILSVFSVIVCIHSSAVIADMTKAKKAYLEENYDVAFSEFSKHANEGDAEAQAKLGIMYFWGRGVLRSESKSYSWSLKSAKQENPEGQQMLGYLYENGIFIPKNMRRAIEWYRKASDQGNISATASLASLYVHGLGITQDIKYGFKLAQTAAEKNNSHAQYIVGDVYKNEYQDHRQARIWFTKAAEQKHGEAANQLGALYYLGQGVAENLEQAYIWFRVAEEYNSLEAPGNRQKVEKRMELDDLLIAEEKVKLWLAKREIKPAKEPLTL